MSVAGVTATRGWFRPPHSRHSSSKSRSAWPIAPGGGWWSAPRPSSHWQSSTRPVASGSTLPHRASSRRRCIHRKPTTPPPGDYPTRACRPGQRHRRRHPLPGGIALHHRRNPAHRRWPDRRSLTRHPASGPLATIRSRGGRTAGRWAREITVRREGVRYRFGVRAAQCSEPSITPRNSAASADSPVSAPYTAIVRGDRDLACAYAVSPETATTASFTITVVR